MILHTVNKSPLLHGALRSCLQFIDEGDGLVLLEDGVYAALSGIEVGLDQFMGNVFVISADVDARGLRERLAPGPEIIDYDRFVALCTEYHAVKNWS